MTHDAELLVGLSEDELQALADSMLAPSAQRRLNELLDRNSEGRLSQSEQSELDGILAKVDQLNILKTRARYTLRHSPQESHC
jgi:hypothetical protein